MAVVLASKHDPVHQLLPVHHFPCWPFIGGGNGPRGISKPRRQGLDDFHFAKPCGRVFGVHQDFIQQLELADDLFAKANDIVGGRGLGFLRNTADFGAKIVHCRFDPAQTLGVSRFSGAQGAAFF